MFSVIIPVHNKLPHIDRSVRSVLNQTLSSFELILVDDASTDGSTEKLQEFDDPRIRILRRDVPGPGGYAARNLGIENAKYNWISFLDADDMWDVKLLQRVHDVITTNPDTAIISCAWAEMMGEPVNLRQHNVLNDHKEVNIKSFDLEDFLRRPNLMWTGAISMKKDILLEAGMFPSCPDCKAGGDFDTWIRGLDVSPSNLYIDEILSFYFRDSVNRVTDFNRNPNNYFCSGTSLKKIYSTVDNPSLKSAIRAFANLHVYVIVKRLISLGYRPSKKLLSEFYWNLYLPIYLAKLSVLFVSKSLKRFVR